MIDRTYPLGETAQAFAYLDAGHARGKVVIGVESARVWSSRVVEVPSVRSRAATSGARGGFMNRVDTAGNLFLAGNSCSQAIAGAFAPVVGLDVREAMSLSSGFGGGMRIGGPCGAATGAVLILGQYFDRDDDAGSRTRVTAAVESFYTEFRERVGATDCLAILGCDFRTPDGREFMDTHGLRQTKCLSAVRAAAVILEEMLELREASRPIASLISKSEKAQQKLTPGTWQHTMLRDNLAALHVALALMGGEVLTSGDLAGNNLHEAIRALASMIDRTQTAQAKLSPGTSQDTLLKNRLKALRIAEALVRAEVANMDDQGWTPVTFENCDHIEGPFYHGTKSVLRPGDELTPGFGSNFQEGRVSNNIYFSALVDTAAWGAELATALAGSDERGHIYIVEPLGSFEDDPNVTNKRFPGNPTQSYRTRESVRVVSEVEDWQGHSPEVLRQMLDHLAQLREQGLDVIED